MASKSDMTTPEHPSVPGLTRQIMTALRLEWDTSARIGAAIFGVALLALLVSVAAQGSTADRYAALREWHYWLSRIGLAAAAIMLGLAVRIGLGLHGDVTPWFRSITYTIAAFMLLQGAIGGVMYMMGGRAGQEVHLIYGYGVVLSLPFFAFVEVTAKKRPAMGSYIWGFTMLAAIIVRCITTGPAGM